MEILGLLDTLEAILLNGKKVPFSSQKRVDTERLVKIIGKIRRIINEKYNADSIQLSEATSLKAASTPQEEAESQDIVQQAKRNAQQMADDVDRYAEDVLTNLHLTVSKLKRNCVKLEHTIQECRDKLSTENSPVGDADE